MNKKRSTWKERQFEGWFVKDPFLPSKGGRKEKVFLVGRERSLRRDTDLLALDRAGGLIVMEIKNERSTREAVGQSLEYLSQFSKANVEALSDRYDELQGDRKTAGSLESDYKRIMGTRLRLNQTRRVILVAPDFDMHSCFGVSYLNDHFSKEGISFLLLQATRKRGHPRDFSLQDIKPPELSHTGDMEGRFILTRPEGGRLAYVLEGGRHPILWVVGKALPEKSVRVAGTEATTRRALRFSSRLVIPADKSDIPDRDMTSTGTAWVSRRHRHEYAKVIGEITGMRRKQGKCRVVFYVSFGKGRRLRGYRERDRTTFLKDWEQCSEHLPPWREIVSKMPKKIR